jgi:hypothetical protein
MWTSSKEILWKADAQLLLTREEEAMSVLLSCADSGEDQASEMIASMSSIGSQGQVVVDMCKREESP